MKSHASMNRIYRLVFNVALGIWVAVAENARGKGKGGGAACALLAVLAILSPAAYAASAGDASVVVGTGSVATSGLTTTINQTSQSLAIDWTQLSTAANESLRFNQPNAQAIALNRITGSSPSSFLGSLTANGQVFILNPNGVLFGAGSQVNVGGLVASTLAMSNADFQAGRHVFTSAGGTGSVVNQGSMTAAQGGYLALLAPEVRNEGVMTASLGTALLAAGNKITLNLDNGSLLGYSIDEKALGALVENKHLIKADGGQVILSARAVDSLSSGVVNNTGVVEAKSLTSVGGKILLEGDLVIQNGTLNASGASSGVQGGNINITARAIVDAGTANASGTLGAGGNITYNATQAIVQSAAANLSANGTTTGGHITLSSERNLFTSGTLRATGQNGGTIDLLGERVVLAAASLDASGTDKGGLIRVGGDFKGANPNIKNAHTTLVNGATTLKANGANGRVAVWSDDKTDFYGNIVATGNGQAEVSSKGTLTYGGNASLGAGGSLLLDPANIIIDDTAGPAAFALQDPNSFAGKQFGNSYLLGSIANNTFTQNGKVVITAGSDNLGGIDAGAAYLFDTSTGALLSTLTGTAGDRVGSSGVSSLNNGNFVVLSMAWGGNKGAVTWGSSTAGVSGVVSAANSLVGSAAGDRVGFFGIATLSNGNYVVASPQWGGAKGAATWGNGSTGSVGEVSAANSLVGGTAGDMVATRVSALTNGNYVTSSGAWGGNKGAATWGNGSIGSIGVVDAGNSLTGSLAGDLVGNVGISALTNGNYVVRSRNWGGNFGAATWGNGSGGTTGTVGSSNSLVGSAVGDLIGDRLSTLTNGNYVVSSSSWGGNKGAATWGDGSTGVGGVKGVVDDTNSLVGSTGGAGGDKVGLNGVTGLTNGNYFVASGVWDGNKGASTWGNGSTGVRGVVDSTNSLVGSTGGANGDKIGSSSYVLTNGNYVIASPSWNNNLGAVTWVNGSTGNSSTGTKGAVGSGNSLVGSTSGVNGVGGDRVGNAVTALTNGNYVVVSVLWTDLRGAVTWGNGATGTTGVVGSSNSLVGSLAGDQLGNNVTRLTNGNYVVGSFFWNNRTGAATWGNGLGGTVGAVDNTNSLVGSNPNDGVSIGGINALSNGNYVVRSTDWSGNRGAVTWGNGAGGSTGTVSAANSLVGSTSGDTNTGDRFGNRFAALSSGDYVVGSPNWSGGRGAVAWGSGTAGVGGAVGLVGASNSLLGAAGDQLGSDGVMALANGNYLVRTPNASSGAGQVLLGVPGNIGFNVAAGQTLRMNPSGIAATLAGGTAVTLQASNDITVNSNITVAGSTGGALTLQAGRSINLNSVITTANGNFTASAGDPAATGPGRMAGSAAINQAPGSAINAGTGVVTLQVGVSPPAPSSVPATVQLQTLANTSQTTQLVAALQSVRPDALQNSLAPQRQQVQAVITTRSERCGIRMPEGFDTADCN